MAKVLKKSHGDHGGYTTRSCSDAETTRACAWSPCGSWLFQQFPWVSIMHCGIESFCLGARKCTDVSWRWLGMVGSEESVWLYERLRKREGFQQIVGYLESLLFEGRNPTPPGSLGPVTCWGGGRQGAGHIELGRVGVTDCPGNTNAIANPFHLQIRKWRAREANLLAQGHTDDE